MSIELNQEWFINIDKKDIHDLDGWNDFVRKRNDYAPPPLLDRATYLNLTAPERRMYDLARRIGNSNLPKHETPMTTRVRGQIEAVLHHNLYSTDPGVRSGVFISADGAMGKSTLMREIAADFDADIRQYRELLPTVMPHRDRWVPIAWVTVPPKLSIRSLGTAILNFYGEYPPSRPTDPQITERVDKVLRDCGTRLIILDDITRYKDGEADRFASDWIRNLMETSVSIVAMGVDVRGSGILYDGKGRPRDEQLRTQTARRFTVLDIDKFHYDSATDIREWVAHLKAVEEDLLLLDKQPGMLSQHLPEFLFQHTNGVIGVLTDWIELTALSIIGRSPSRGGEFLTRTDFEAIPVKAQNGQRTTQAEPKQTGNRRGKKGRNTMYDQPKHGAA